MSIEAKKVNTSGMVTTVKLTSDPSDLEIIKALGGDEKSILLFLGEKHGWNIYKLDSKSDILVLGSAPDISADPKNRQSCDLSDDQIRNIIQ